MKPILNESQALIADSAAKLCAGIAGPARFRALASQADRVDALAWQQIVDAGWPLLMVPENAGGLDAGLFELGLILEAAGEQLLSAPVAAACAAAHVLAQAGQAVPDAGTGLTLPLWLDEADAYDGAARRPIARDEGGTWVVEGALPYTTFAQRADTLIVPLVTQAGEPLLARVAATDFGLRRDLRLNVDQTASASVAFDALRLTPDRMIARGAEAQRLAADIATILQVGISAELIGLASRALAMTLEHLRTRKQFGKPLASFQALQHRCVDCYVDLELNRSLLYRVSQAWDRGQANPAMVAALKARTSRAALAATRVAVQMHGAMGYTQAHDIGLYYKKALGLAAAFGNENHHAARFSRLTLDAGAAV